MHGQNHIKPVGMFDGTWRIRNSKNTVF